MTYVYKRVRGGNEDEGARRLSVVPTNRIDRRQRAWIKKPRKFHLNTRKHFFSCSFFYFFNVLLFLLTCTHSSFVQFTSFTSRHTIYSFMLSYTLAACPRGSYFMEDTYTIHEVHNLIYCYTCSHLDFGTDTAAAVQWETPADSSSAIQDPRCSHCREMTLNLGKE